MPTQTLHAAIKLTGFFSLVHNFPLLNQHDHPFLTDYPLFFRYPTGVSTGDRLDQETELSQIIGTGPRQSDKYIYPLSVRCTVIFPLPPTILYLRRCSTLRSLYPTPPRYAPSPRPAPRHTDCSSLRTAAPSTIRTAYHNSTACPLPTSIVGNK